MSYFRKDRNLELSVLKYLTDQINSSWSNITVVKAFKDVYTKDIAIPIVCARLEQTTNTRLEVGSKTLEERYLIVIDIFARSDAQRVDLAAFIKDKLKDGWVHYDHGHVSGDNSVLDLTANGRDFVTGWITDSRIDLGETTDDKDKYRHNISVRVRKSS